MPHRLYGERVTVTPGPAPDDASAFSSVVRVASIGSTNSVLAAALRRADGEPWPHLSVLVAENQTEGRGRAGRRWETPPGSSLTASVVLRPAVPLARWPWLSLLGGLAVARGVTARTGLSAALKWPNDVVLPQVGGAEVPGWGRARKLGGVLVETVCPRGVEPAAVLGFGVNLEQQGVELPVPWATSLAAQGVAAAVRDRAHLLEAVGTELSALLAPWQEANGDAAGSGLLLAVEQACVTLGRDVRADLPGGRVVTGRAAGLSPDGALLVRTADGTLVAVTAGDVDHLRLSTG